MPTINLNDTRSSGKLSEADFRTERASMAWAQQIDDEQTRDYWPPRRGGVDIDAIHAKHQKPKQTLPACAGPCDQGRKLCPCPEACERGAADDDMGAARGIVYALIASLAIWAFGTAVWLALR
jgi:hypothetical protein